MMILSQNFIRQIRKYLRADYLGGNVLRSLEKQSKHKRHIVRIDVDKMRVNIYTDRDSACKLNDLTPVTLRRRIEARDVDKNGYVWFAVDPAQWADEDYREYLMGMWAAAAHWQKINPWRVGKAHLEIGYQMLNLAPESKVLKDGRIPKEIKSLQEPLRMESG